MSSIMDFDRIEKRAKRNTIIRNVVVYGLLAVWALVVLFPFYWMLLTSVKTQGSYASEIVPKLFTLSPTAENYLAVFTEAVLGRYFFNTFVFTVPIPGIAVTDDTATMGLNVLAVDILPDLTVFHGIMPPLCKSLMLTA